MQDKLSKRYRLAPFAETIRQARLQKGWTQRDLSARARMPQAQISRFENGEVDPQVSTLVELARTLDLDLQLVPRSAITAVEAAVRAAEERSDERVLRDLLAKLRTAAQDAHRSAPERDDIASIQASLRELDHLAPLIRGPEILAELHKLLLNLQQFVIYPPAQRGSHAKSYVDAAAWLKRFRNQMVHAPQAERPAYSLDDEED
ncbi:MAG: helix-turn-helix transcriptional regulator [Devosia sp.]|nr:helix-turn-helix transcriptional regulator [Devosia sp.]